MVEDIEETERLLNFVLYPKPAANRCLATTLRSTVTEDTAGLDFFADATTGVDIVVAAGVDIVAAAGASIVADAVAGMVVASTVSFGLDGMHSP